MKSFRNSLLKPEKLNTDTYKNPLNNIDFKLDDIINDLTLILTYLRDGYSKDFKKEGNGIEACADYFYKMKKTSDN